MGEKQNEKLKEITERLERGILEIFTSERYREYLQVMSRFHNYSLNNTVLIAMQKPEATLVAGFQAWKTKFGRTVKKGEKGIRILAPAPCKVKKEKLDPVTKLPVIGEDGEPVTEEKVTIPFYRTAYVFDISQTEGRELPSSALDELTGNVEQYKDFFAALERVSPYPIAFEEIHSAAYGYCDFVDKRIVVDVGMSELQNLKTTIHEIAHARLHDFDRNAPKEERPKIDRNTGEVQAESVAYTVCQHYGLDTSDYSFGYVASWSSGKTLPELRKSLETIKDAAAEIINGIDSYFVEINQEFDVEKAYGTAV